MTNKFHNAWRGFLKEQEEQTSEESLDSELTKEELAMWQQALKDVKGSFSLKESFLLEFLNEHDNKILLEVEEEDEPENPEEPEYDPVLDHPETVTGDEALVKMRTTKAQQKAAEEEEYEKLRTSTPPELGPTGQASFDFPKPGDEFIIPISSKYSSESDFCQVFPEINRWTQENADNFGEAILFVYATMQTSWPRVATFFRFLVDFVKKNAKSPEVFENFVYRPRRTQQQTDYNEYKFYLGRERYAVLARRLREAKKLKTDPARKRQIRKKIKELASLRGRGGRKAIETNKRLKARYERLVSLLNDSKNVKGIEIDIQQEVQQNKQSIQAANGVSYEEARENYIEALGNHNDYRRDVLTDLFRDVKGLQGKKLSDDQKEYIGRARGIIAYMAATPGAKFYVPTWNNREAYFSSVSGPLSDYNKSETKDPSHLLDLLVEVVKIPGIGVVKGGFLVQLLTGQLGCVDNIWQKILAAQDKIIADMVKKIVRTSKNREKDLREYASRYISLLDTLEKTYSIDSKNIFEVWLQITKFASTRGGDKKGYKLDVVTLPQGADLSQDDSFLKARGVPISIETDKPTLDFYGRGGGPARSMQDEQASEEESELGDPTTPTPDVIAQQHRFGQLGYPVEEGRVERTFKKWKKMEWL